jgi:hypothetical protein
VDTRYLDHRGQPKPLAIRGAGRSFSRLVHEYAGDIPSRAVLSELSRLGVVRQVGRFVKVQAPSLLRRRQSLRTLTSLMPILVDGIRLAANEDKRFARATAHRLTLSANSIVNLEILRNRCASSVTSMMAGLRDTLSDSTSALGRRTRASHSCSVSVLLVENRNSGDSGRELERISNRRKRPRVARS